MAGALIVTVEIARADLAWLDRLRRAHYPAERNHLAAHLTMFRALPPSAEAEAGRALAVIAGDVHPRAWIDGLMDLGGGVAFRIASPDLDRVRQELADRFHGLLGVQDAGGWRPHITIQNKVAPRQARALMASFDQSFPRRPLLVSGLGLHRYLGCPWDKIAVYSFRN